MSPLAGAEEADKALLELEERGRKQAELALQQLETQSKSTADEAAQSLLKAAQVVESVQMLWLAYSAASTEHAHRPADRLTD